LSELEHDFLAQADRLRAILRAVTDAHGRQAPQPAERRPSPELLSQALEQLLAVLGRVSSDAAALATLGSADLSRLGDDGLSLLGDLEAWTITLGLTEERRDLQALMVALALWSARRGGRISLLEPLVNALAAIANRMHEPAALGRLCTVMDRVLDAVHPRLQQDPDKSNPGRPWRVLQLNRAIVATRSHDPERMTLAFERLIRDLPEEAPAFFREGMRQMQELNYPPQVRNVMQQYLRQWSGRRLH
jgi:hypothetical protein